MTVHSSPRYSDPLRSLLSRYVHPSPRRRTRVGLCSLRSLRSPLVLRLRLGPLRGTNGSGEDEE